MVTLGLIRLFSGLEQEFDQLCFPSSLVDPEFQRESGPSWSAVAPCIYSLAPSSGISHTSGVVYHIFASSNGKCHRPLIVIVSPGTQCNLEGFDICDIINIDEITSRDAAKKNKAYLRGDGTSPLFPLKRGPGIGTRCRIQIHICS
jgi:hypothetical protein